MAIAGWPANWAIRAVAAFSTVRAEPKGAARDLELAIGLAEESS